MLKLSETQRKGSLCEKTARVYLQQQGLITISTNFRCKLGEIDLIMRDKQYVIFVEVRYRQRSYFGGAMESIHGHKQQRIIRTAHCFLQKYRWATTLPSRFDVVTLSGDLSKPEIEWTKDAFQL